MFGHVRTISDKKPIFMIKVSVYRPDLTLIGKAYTNDDGYYSVDIPPGESVTVLFDTHHTLNNAEDWQPSLVANVIAENSKPLDRYLVPAGQFADTTTGVDVLGAFLLAAAAGDAEKNGEPDVENSYARSAAARLSRIKQNTLALQNIQAALLRYFEEHQ
ncbi:carboxypeptidase regulatory-like domain-containing protein [Streptomyces sp. NBC_00287]|uniref:carboxypeptidase regulatory-like domain-containing protein n=1 Tax=Streptomyces sp. NBC_00287 TaxID=2975702 RepID=UPI002E2D193A|nr:carboxypeptidase regulatory-like domain-containing protein [Streptomyces sp. NBC_00287]